MQVLEGEDDLGDVEESYVVREHVFSAKKSEDLATLDVLECEINMSAVLETLMADKLGNRRYTYRLTMNGK